METSTYARWFRGSTPYISAHRNKTFVVLVPGEAFEHVNLSNMVHDLALLHVLGVRLILVHGGRPQIEQALPESFYHGHRRVTDELAMSTITAVNGQLRTRLEALFSTGLPNSPLHKVDIPVIAGNFITAQPMGILDGVDHLFTGSVRRVEIQRIKNSLDGGALIIQSPVGYSPSGQVFNLPAEEVAAEIAIALQADKLIFFDEVAHLSDDQGQRISTVTPASLEQALATTENANATRLEYLQQAVRRGVTKSHLVPFTDDGALLAELFTAEGIGTQVVEQQHKGIRTATREDVAGIVEVIRPLEESGALVRRERDRLEQEIDNFLVAELDGIVVGCCAVYPYGAQAELACVGVHENYQAGNGVGARLLAAAEETARNNNVNTLFVLTTQTRDWFLEQGFTDASPDQLPEQRQMLYNWQRNSAVMIKEL
ncbi:MAG: amino-acid N-acetyltransferase [Pseudomonadaceae bacterium]|nr:amino-acid N-acetyltransferase [Pseudomonadaceae bacterium]